MARKSPWQEFAENFQGVYGTFKQIGQDVETGRIMDDEKFTAEGAAGAGLSGSALDKARYKALGDIYTKYGNAKEGLAMRQSVSNLEASERKNELDAATLQERIRQNGLLQSALMQSQAYQNNASGNASNANANQTSQMTAGKVQELANRNRQSEQAIEFTDLTQGGLVAKTNAESQAGVSKALSDQKVTDNMYSWLSQTAQNEAAFTDASSQIDLDGLKYLAESERLSSLAKEYQLAGATADRNTYQIAAMEEYRTDIQSGKFGEGDDFDQGAATNAFLQLTAAFEGQPAATALYNQYVKDGNEAELGTILNKGMVLGAKVKNALTGPDGISGVQVLFDEENGEDFGMRFGQVQLADGTMGIGLIETNEETGEDMRAIAAAANEVELGAMLETMTGPTGMIGLAERLYQRDKRALDTKKTKADIASVEQSTLTSQEQAANLSRRSEYIGKQISEFDTNGALTKAQTKLAEQRANQIMAELDLDRGISNATKEKTILQEVAKFVTTQQLNYPDQDAAALQQKTSDFVKTLRDQTAPRSSSPVTQSASAAGLTQSQWDSLSDAEKAQFP